MAMAAGKSAGKAPRTTDKAFKPPSEAAMAMTGNPAAAKAGGRTGDVWPVARAVCFCRGSGVNFVFIILTT
jgi:hypothetical protein